MRKKLRILIVDDDALLSQTFSLYFHTKGCDVTIANSGKKGINVFEEKKCFDLVLLDLLLPDMNGIDVLKRLKCMDAAVPVIMVSGVGKTKTIIEAIKAGAHDYIIKPVEAEELEAVINKTIHEIQSGDYAKQADPAQEEFTLCVDFITDNNQMESVKQTAKEIADCDEIILVLGESGVGKEVVARFIHNQSKRAKSPFVKVNCAAIPDDLLESELFGHERGAFSGAITQKPGKFELAKDGTIFLDEISEMNLHLQAKLLHVLQDRTYTRLGGKSDIKAKCHIIVATNRNLQKEVQKGKFRDDLYYRLNVVTIFIPPLRERKDDIVVLLDFFLKKYQKKYQRYINISQALINSFLTYTWPGNIRELENMVKRLVILGNEYLVLREIEAGEKTQFETDPAEEKRQNEASIDGTTSLKEISKRAAYAAEKKLLSEVLHKNNWNKKKSAKILNISYKALLYKMKEYGLQ